MRKLLGKIYTIEAALDFIVTKAAFAIKRNYRKLNFSRNYIFYLSCFFSKKRDCTYRSENKYYSFVTGSFRSFFLLPFYFLGLTVYHSS